MDPLVEIVSLHAFAELQNFAKFGKTIFAISETICRSLQEAIGNLVHFTEKYSFVE